SQFPKHLQKAPLIYRLIVLFSSGVVVVLLFVLLLSFVTQLLRAEGLYLPLAGLQASNVFYQMRRLAGLVLSVAGHDKAPSNQAHNHLTITGLVPLIRNNTLLMFHFFQIRSLLVWILLKPAVLPALRGYSRGLPLIKSGYLLPAAYQRHLRSAQFYASGLPS